MVSIQRFFLCLSNEKILSMLNLKLLLFATEKSVKTTHHGHYFMFFIEFHIAHFLHLFYFVEFITH
jgi:hypothetical protein